MLKYIFHRLILIPITIIGITWIVFGITRLVPGGPIDRILTGESGRTVSAKQTGSQQGSINLTESQLEHIEDDMLLRVSLCSAYLQWLGLMPREINHRYIEQTEMHDTPALPPGWSSRLEFPQQRAQRWADRMGITDAGAIHDKALTYSPRMCLYQENYAGVIQGKLGNSYKYNTSVWSMMKETLPISLYFGILSAIITYGISIPLGTLKALHHHGIFDTLSSMAILICYAIPGFALGALCTVFLCARMDLFPLGGLTSPGFSEMDFLQQCLDLGKHSVLPLLCYTIGAIPITTMLVKNSLMDSMSSEYIRTAQAKGLTFRQAVLTHALPNSYIPLLSTLGGVICALAIGSLLIEQIFDIHGFGLLSFQSLIDRDYPVVMGALLVTSTLMVAGNLVSDILVAFSDPRIRFRK